MNAILRAAIASALIASSPALSAAADRAAEAILADYRAVANPKSDPARKDPEAVREFRRAWTAADARRSELALELFRSHPEDPEVPTLLRARWVNTMMSPASAGATILEIDRALPLFRDPKAAREARFMRAIATIQANLEAPERALPAIDAFILEDPKDSRDPVLLAGFASSIEDAGLRAKLLRRLVLEYPEHPSAKSAQATLALLENLGKPLDLEFDDAIRGTHVSIGGLKGKVVVLDFWATWCGPCVAEMPRMKRLYAEFKDRGVEFIGVSLDVPKDEGGLDKLKAFVEKNGIGWPLYYQGNGWESEFSRKMGIGSIPQLFLVDADGKLASIDARGKLEALLPEFLARAKSAADAR